MPDPRELGQVFGAMIGVLLSACVLVALGQGLGRLAEATARAWGL